MRRSQLRLAIEKVLSRFLRQPQQQVRYVEVIRIASLSASETVPLCLEGIEDPNWFIRVDPFVDIADHDVAHRGRATGGNPLGIS